MVVILFCLGNQANASISYNERREKIADPSSVNLIHLYKNKHSVSESDTPFLRIRTINELWLVNVLYEGSLNAWPYRHITKCIEPNRDPSIF